MNFIFIKIPIKMAISHQGLSLGVAAVEKTKRKNIIELQYTKIQLLWPNLNLRFGTSVLVSYVFENTLSPIFLLTGSFVALRHDICFSV